MNNEINFVKVHRKFTAGRRMAVENSVMTNRLNVNNRKFVMELSVEQKEPGH